MTVRPPQRRRARAVRGQGRGRWLGLAVAAVLGAAGAAALVLVLRPAPPPAPPPVVERTPPAPVVVGPEPSRDPTADILTGVPSRSRGRTDWIFFFKTGDRLVRMGQAEPLGLVIRTEPVHTFPDGTTGPAYLLQIPEGGQLFVDADQLERGARIQ
jgi:hypothetical protein